MKNLVKQAVFPVAGLGTRFLPATKANPKEMLPVVDKPLIQYAVEEAVDAGITKLIFVTSSSKRAIEDHFDLNYELESELSKKGKESLLKIVRDIVPQHVTCIYIRQPQALGLGHAVLCAKPAVGDDPFAVILADDLIDGRGYPCLKQMVELFREQGVSLLAVEEIAQGETDKYGIIDPGIHVSRASNGTPGELFPIKDLVEKPIPAQAPSNLAVIGRYILTPRVMTLLEGVSKGSGGEIQLTDAIAKLLHEESVLAYLFKGVRYDCGSKLGYLEATVAYGLKHPEFGKDFRAYLLHALDSLKDHKETGVG